MKTVAPDYYRSFKCRAEKCRHSCCTGWEIDIDEASEKRYLSVGGDFGRKLSVNISHSGNTHFVLGEDERCPFLTPEGLCEIYIRLGADALCEICAEHPRFRNFCSDRTEVGLGLCCEEAAEIVLSKRIGMRFAVLSDDAENYDADCGETEFFELRSRLFDIVADESKCIEERLFILTECVGIALPEKSTSEWREFFERLEILDGAWAERLSQLTDCIEFGVLPTVDEDSRFYANLAEYFLFRHLADGYFSDKLREYVGFAVLGVKMIGALCAAEIEKNGKIDFAAACDIARMYSSEIEYDEDNVEMIIALLSS